MEASQQQQQAYFDRIAAEFDGHYATKKGPWEMIIDRIFRQGMVQRWDYLTKQMSWQDQSVLDVGCGPGRYMAAFVGKGAREVIGLDFAASMIDIAQKNLKQVGAESKCRTMVGDFLTTDFNETFDSVVAMGYFDYILGQKALDEHFGKMWAIANQRVVASFPARWSFKTFPRWVWLSARSCPVQFFTAGEIEAMMKRLGVPHYKLIHMSGTILAIAEKK